MHISDNMLLHFLLYSNIVDDIVHLDCFHSSNVYRGMKTVKKSDILSVCVA